MACVFACGPDEQGSRVSRPPVLTLLPPQLRTLPPSHFFPLAPGRHNEWKGTWRQRSVLSLSWEAPPRLKWRDAGTRRGQGFGGVRPQRRCRACSSEKAVLEAGLERPRFPHHPAPISSPQKIELKACGSVCVYVLLVMGREERGESAWSACDGARHEPAGVCGGGGRHTSC